MFGNKMLFGMNATEKNIYTNTLVHLPDQKQKELAIITSYIRKAANPEMIILFGSHATDRWVTDHYTDDGTVYEYASDYDIVVVTPQKRNYGAWVWPNLREKIRRDPRLGRTTLIHHSISVFNEKVRDRYYFFVDIYQEGVLLYDSGKCQLEGPQPLDPEKRKKKAEEYLDYWWQKAEEFYKHYGYAMKDEYHNMGAFLLHQTAECLYAGFLLVFTDHKPKTHDLEELGEVSIRVHRQLARIFPKPP